MIYRFDSCELNTENFTLRVNTEVQLVEPHVFDLILYLIEHRGRLVSRDELFKNLWSGREVCDATLSNTIKCARAAIGDDGEQQAIIRTTRGRGYQFIAEIKGTSIGANNSTISKPSASPTSSPIFTALSTKRHLISLLAVTLLLIFIMSEIWSPASEITVSNAANDNKQKSIAVLPFRNLSELEKDVFFTEGVHDDLLVHISKISAIKSISRSSVMTYHNSSKNMQTIGKELNVSTILQGSVQRAADQIRINVHLVNTLTNENIWAESYTRILTAKNIFDIQEEIAKNIAIELETALSPKELAYIEKLPTQNLSALEAYFRAKESSRKNNSDGYQQAIIHLEHAVKLDPNFSTAYALLANFQVGQIYWLGLSPKEQIAKAKALIAITMKLDSNSSELYLAIGWLKRYEQDFSAADAAFKTAIKLSPNNAEAYAAYAGLYMSTLKNSPQAISLLLKAASLSPKDDNLPIELAQAFIYVGRFDEAKSIIEDIIARKPNFSIAHRKLSFIKYFAEHNITGSLRSLYKSVELDPVPFYFMVLGFNHASIGDKKQAIAWFNYTLQLAPEFEGANYCQGLIHTLNGDYNAAVDSYLKIPKIFEMGHVPMYYLMKASIQTQRLAEVMEHFQINFPELFQAEFKVDTTNFIAALALGRLLKQKGETVQANRLFKASLQVAKKRIHGSWTDNQYNWVVKIHLAMGNKEAALKAFADVVEEGWFSEELINDDEYHVLRDEPLFQQLQQTMKHRLKLEQEKLSKMRINGELYSIPTIL
ncbi:hypothetical protein CXF95_07515 [Paraglaciecola sp. MB-3u-78]|nr:hypothetical protein CXF95_07515 [Paraglaciecola sp. MB-3u-78]